MMSMEILDPGGSPRGSLLSAITMIAVAVVIQ